ncbi:hypothetical protein [Sinomonas sp. P10A9]|uniref:Uncharacterized protein n=1 Tax=Sinomonas puerhi TaxID=3238584 RepID=A0AB39L0K0_9MICC
MSRNLGVVCTHGFTAEDVTLTEDHPRLLGALVWDDDLPGATILFAEKRGLVYRRVTVRHRRRGVPGASASAAEDYSVIEFHCGHCGFDKDVRRERLASCFEDGEPRMDLFPPDARGVSRLDIWKLR